jgi:hypothetical protein
MACACGIAKRVESKSVPLRRIKRLLFNEDIAKIL